MADQVDTPTNPLTLIRKGLPAGSPLAEAFKVLDPAVVTPTDEGSAEKSDGEKHDHEAYEPVSYAGGSETFDEYDKYREAESIEGAVNQEMFVFEMLVSNVMTNSELGASEKAAKLAALAISAGPRIEFAEAEARAEKEAEEAGAGAGAEVQTTEEAGQTKEETPADGGVFRAFRDTTGALRWVAIHSNNYQDREGETFSADSHKEYVDWVDRTKNFPALRLWHVPFDLGFADMVDFDGNFMVSTGTFAKEFEHVGEALERSKEPLGCSHGFQYRPQDLRDGVYDRYRSFEVSVLPLERAANLHTAFFARGDIPMLTTEKREFAVKMGGEEFATAIENTTATMKEGADKTGVTFKGLVDFYMKDDESPEGEAAPETPPEPVAATPPETDGEATADAVAAATVTEPEGEAEGEADPEAEKDTSGIAAIVANAVKSEITPLAEKITALEADKASVDEKVAEAIRPANGPAAAIAHSKDGAEVPVSVAEALKAALDAPESGAKNADPIASYVGMIGSN